MPGRTADVRVRWGRLAVAGAGGAVLARWHLGVPSVRGDEVYYRRAALSLLDGDRLDIAQHPPLVKELMAVSMGLLGDGAVAMRLPAMVCAWLTGLVVAALVREVAGRTTWGALAGLAAALAWWTLPYGPTRTATLEGPLGLIVLLALWSWTRASTDHRRRWLVLGGACAGLAVATKLTGALVLAGVLPLLWSRWRGGGRPVRALAVVGVSCLVTWALAHLPMGSDAVEAVRTSVTFQLEHAETGHPHPVAGRDWVFPPWWSGWWYQAQVLGVPGTVALWVLAMTGALRHRRRAAVVTVTLVALAVATALAPLQLPHYQYAWWPPLVVLAALAPVPSPPQAPRTGRAATAARAGTAGRVVTAGALCLLVPLAVAAADHVTDVARLRPSDYRAAAPVVRSAVPSTTPITSWAEPGATRLVLPDQRLRTALPADGDPPVLLVEPEWARRHGYDLPRWERERTASYEEHVLGDVTVYVRTP